MTSFHPSGVSRTPAIHAQITRVCRRRGRRSPETARRPPRGKMWFSQREGIPPRRSPLTPPRLPSEMRTRRAGPVTLRRRRGRAPRALPRRVEPARGKKPAASSSDARAAAAAPATTRRGARGASASAKGYYQV